MNEIVVGPGVEVTMHFALKLTDGSVVDSNFSDKPATFIYGDGNVSPGFEEAILGIGVGAKETYLIPPEKGFGQHNPSNIQKVARSEFPEDIELSVGLVLSFSDAQNTDLPGVIVKIEEKEITVDFNHPLAGREIVFEVHILSLTPAVKH